jgi:hypothetical protein
MRCSASFTLSIYCKLTVMLFKHCFVLYRVNPYALSILAMESASLAQIANLIIRSCTTMLHHQPVRPQLLDVCWHMHHPIQKSHQTMTLEGLEGLAIQIPSKHPLVKQALRERRPKPSSVSCSCCSPFLTRVIICNNI